MGRREEGSSSREGEEITYKVAGKVRGGGVGEVERADMWRRVREEKWEGRGRRRLELGLLVGGGGSRGEGSEGLVGCWHGWRVKRLER